MGVGEELVFFVTFGGQIISRHSDALSQHVGAIDNNSSFGWVSFTAIYGCRSWPVVFSDYRKLDWIHGAAW